MTVRAPNVRCAYSDHGSRENSDLEKNQYGDSNDIHAGKNFNQ